MRSNYKVYFEFMGKKMVTTIAAKSKEESVEILRNKIHIHQIMYDPEVRTEHGEDFITFFEDILRGKK